MTAIASPPKILTSALENIEISLLRQVIIDAEMERKNHFRRTHPRLYSGWLAYAERVALLRERVPTGWEILEEHGQAGVVTRDGRFRILPMTGDASTGHLDGPGPRTLKRGVCTFEAVRANYETVFGHPQPQQVLLFDPCPQVSPPADTITILLLVFREGDHLQAELAIPVEMANSGNYTAFTYHERLLVLDESIAPASVEVSETEEEHIDIAIDEI